MWENVAPSAVPPQNGRAAGRPARAAAQGGDWVLWGQILLAAALVAFAFCARRFALPVYPDLRTAFDAAMERRLPLGEALLPEERSLAKFTEWAQETAAEARGAVRETLAALRAAAPATGESARPAAHRKNAKTQGDPVPAGCMAGGYVPDYALVFPLLGYSGTKTSGYGWRADPMGGSGSDFHLGNDLAAAEGTPVVAAADGVVRLAGVHKSYGNYVRILHEGGDETLYAHLQYLFVHTGQTVTAGQQLGTSGDTGNTTGPHLHFEILHKGARYDPAQALESAS